MHMGGGHELVRAIEAKCVAVPIQDVLVPRCPHSRISRVTVLGRFFFFLRGGGIRARVHARVLQLC